MVCRPAAPGGRGSDVADGPGVAEGLDVAEGSGVAVGPGRPSPRSSFFFLSFRKSFILATVLEVEKVTTCAGQVEAVLLAWGTRTVRLKRQYAVEKRQPSRYTCRAIAMVQGEVTGLLFSLCWGNPPLSVLRLAGTGYRPGSGMGRIV